MKKILISIALVLTIIFGFLYFTNINAKAAINNDYKIYLKQGAHNLYVTKNYSAAVSDFEKALQLNPNEYSIYCLLGMSYGQIGNVKKSEEILTLATKKFPDEWVAYTFLGDIKHQQKQTPIAIEYYKKALNSPTLPNDKKAGLEKIIQNFINEQNVYEAKSSTPSGEKITTNLNGNIWKKAYFKGTDAQWMIEYGLKNEDVLNYKWTKLVTVNFYDKNAYNFTNETIYNGFYTLLNKTTNGLNSSLYMQKIPSPKGTAADEIYFEWKIKGRGESEICRIFKGNRGFYFGHYAHKKETFTQQEKTEAIQILKSIKEI